MALIIRRQISSRLELLELFGTFESEFSVKKILSDAHEFAKPCMRKYFGTNKFQIGTFLKKSSEQNPFVYLVTLLFLELWNLFISL